MRNIFKPRPEGKSVRVGGALGISLWNYTFPSSRTLGVYPHQLVIGLKYTDIIITIPRWLRKK